MLRLSNLISTFLFFSLIQNSHALNVKCKEITGSNLAPEIFVSIKPGEGSLKGLEVAYVEGFEDRTLHLACAKKADEFNCSMIREMRSSDGTRYGIEDIFKILTDGTMVYEHLSLGVTWFEWRYLCEKLD